jgi:hypothetical protein
LQFEGREPRSRPFSFREAREEFRDGQPGDRIAQIGSHGRQRLEDEPPLAEPRVRHAQPGLVEDVVPREDEIDVERAGRVRPRPRAPVRALDGVQRVEDFARAERAVADAGGVEERRIGRGSRSLSRSLDQGREAEAGEKRGYVGSRRADGGRAIAEAAAEGEGDGTGGRRRRRRRV